MKNKNLLLKLLHRLHHPEGLSRARWVRSRVGLVDLRGNIEGAPWRDLEDLLPLYQAITCSEVFHGAATSFWHDRWLSAGRLCEMFPLLHSHAVGGDVAVEQVMGEGLNTHLASRLSRLASEELVKLNELIDRVSLREGEDQCLCPLNGNAIALQVGAVYNNFMAFAGSPSSAFAKFVWRNRAAPRVQFFA
uniref:Uncharacterized protein n=1 Tax=Setaria viridis TaxID=4556 RepID=A0A4U6U036_SETVI|nr:hypothetical protein SEVIR_7G248950v2 [Setaria viridis]